jgi:hypothetical protein
MLSEIGTAQKYNALVAELQAEISWLKLTDAEREAIYRSEARLRTAYVPDDETAATLRKLLERLQ